MFKSLIFFVRFFLFWLLFFAIDRFMFMFIFHKKLRDIPLGEKIATYYHALRLDLSFAAYISVIPLLLYIGWLFTKKQEVNFKWVHIYNRILVVIFSILSVVNFNIYREWGSKVNERAISFAFNSPGEAFASSASSPLLFSLLMLALLIGTGFYLHFVVVKTKIHFGHSPFWFKPTLAIILLSINFLLIRGGVGVSPNNQSMAYFSSHEILNLASLNTEWNLVSSVLASKKTDHNPYIFTANEAADKDIANLYKVEKDSTTQILTTKTPNIVLVIMESFTANLTKTLGNEDGLTPNFDRLIKEGVLFSQIYAAGNRTDKGLVGTLTGFPTLGTGSIVKWPEKMRKIPAISQKFAERNYKTSFFYGGESEFDNYKAFLLSHSYEKITDKNSFEKKDMNSKWGAYDDLVFKKQLQALNSTKQPFFSTILTLTNHEPFELPVSHKFGTANNLQKFKGTAYYTDSCLNAYLQSAKKQPWYKNTLFIFIADHGHLYPKENFEIFHPKRYHIPLLFYGDVIQPQFKGKKMEKTGSQQDLAATLLKQLGFDTKEFLWSKNLLNPYSKSFAFFSWDDGLGFVNNNQCVTFDNIGKHILFNSNPTDTTQTKINLNLGRSYLQSAYQQFIKL